MSEKYSFLFVPVDGVGHFNACIGVASVLRERGHTVTFATPMTWKGKLEPLGFLEEVYQISDDSVSTEVAGFKWGEMINKLIPFFTGPTIEVHKHFYVPLFEEICKQNKYCHTRFLQIMENVKPDVVVLDNFIQIPAFMDTGVPWIHLISVTPLGISRENVPPPYAGYATDGDRALWQTWEDTVKELYKDLLSDYNQWLVDNGSGKIKLLFPFMETFSPYANMYMYPLELDYNAYRQNPPNFYQFDGYVNETEEVFKIPETLRTGPGKLIYFSMGTIGCVEVGLMKRLIGILSASPNRFIVSKGPNGDEIELGGNMWGANSVAQKSVLPMVDLVVTHGGNNTITESFYFGKRVLVLPLLFDQLDNGQRIHETGLGLTFHPYKVTKEELLNGIEKLLADELLEKRMKTISRRIQASNSRARAADLVEEIARKNKL